MLSLLLDRSDTATVAAAIGASLAELTNEPWYAKLPPVALENWEDFSLEARAAVRVMAHRLVLRVGASAPSSWKGFILAVELARCAQWQLPQHEPAALLAVAGASDTATGV